MVASRTAGSWPSHRNLSNSVFLRVLFWKRAARFVIIRGGGGGVVLLLLFRLLIVLNAECVKKHFNFFGISIFVEYHKNI